LYMFWVSKGKIEVFLLLEKGEKVKGGEGGKGSGKGKGGGGKVRNWSLSPAHPRRLWDHVVMADTLAEIKRKVATNADLLLGDVH